MSLIGFWEWRLALMMALAIPITLAMTFGVTYMLGIDLQQVSVATLIIALGSVAGASLPSKVLSSPAAAECSTQQWNKRHGNPVNLVLSRPRNEGFTNLAVVLLISLVGIYLALLIQFNNAVKPLLVFATAPHGAIGALIALAIMGTPFGSWHFLE